MLDSRNSKPEPSALTEFYRLRRSGCIGALFNAIVAPLIFTRLIEYQVVLALALPLLLTPAEGWKREVETIADYLSQPSSLDETDREFESLLRF
jgi:hypothetical protein